MKRKIYRLLVTILIVACGGLIVPADSPAITIREEEDLARQYLQVISKYFEFVEDPQILSYVRSISHRIMSVVPQQPFKYRFYVIKEEVYNAFAIPAGHIFLHSGLIEAMDGEDELAGILSHEIAHVVCRHISDRIERSKKIRIASIAGMLAAALAGAAGEGDAAGAISSTSQAAAQSAMLSYTRENEVQADEIGLKYLQKAGYSGEGLMRVLKKIRSKTWYGKDMVPTYLRTHPASDDRIAYIDTWMQTHPIDSKDLNNFDNSLFVFTNTRLRALYKDPLLAMQKFEAAIQREPDNYLHHYGYGLTLCKIGRYNDAEVQLKKALNKRALDPYILTALGQAYYLEGQFERALSIFEGVHALDTYIPENELFLGRAYLSLGRYADAEYTLEKLIMNVPNYSEARYYLGKTYGEQGKDGPAHYHLGVYYYKKGNLRNAVFHLNRALPNLEDPEKRKEVETFLQHFKKAAQGRRSPLISTYLKKKDFGSRPGRGLNLILKIPHVFLRLMFLRAVYETNYHIYGWTLLSVVRNDEGIRAGADIELLAEPSIRIKV